MYAKILAASVTAVMTAVTESSPEYGTDVVSAYSTMDQDVVLRLHNPSGPSDVLIPANSMGISFPSRAGSLSIAALATLPSTGTLILNRHNSGV